MKHIFLSIILLIFQFNYSQNNSIKRAKLSNEILIKTINNFIEDVETKNPEFKKIGYIEIKIIYYDRNALGKNFNIKYQIKDQYFKPNLKNDILPKYYLYLKNKLILIYNLVEEKAIMLNYKKSYLKKLNKIIKPYLKKTEHIKAKDKLGNIIIDDNNFIDEKFNLHSGIILSIRNNNSYTIE